jgi:hypothetical protein
MDYETLKAYGDNGVGVIANDEFIIDFISDRGNNAVRSKILKALETSKNGGYMLLRAKSEDNKRDIPMILAKFTAKEDSGLCLFYADNINDLVPIFVGLNKEMGINTTVEGRVEEWFKMILND